jgi:hypothetical protein
MNETKQKVGKSKITRSETVTVRLAPDVRYFAELAARSQRRTLSSFIEWAIEHSFDGAVELTKKDGGKVPISQVQAELWDVDEHDRFIRLAKCFPSLLNYDEQRRLKELKNKSDL